MLLAVPALSGAYFGSVGAGGSAYNGQLVVALSQSLQPADDGLVLAGAIRTGQGRRV